MTTHTDVVIVGAGPTGLLLAGDLAARGVACTVLERRGEQTANTTRAFAVHARTLEQLDARGLADELIATGTTVDEFRLFGKLAVGLADLPSRFRFVLITPQNNVERLLERRALKAGARILRGVRFTGLAQDTDGIDVHAEASEPNGEGGETAVETHLRASYLVGTDGVRSAVREAVGLPYPGSQVVKSLMLADVRLNEPPSEVLTVNGVAEGFAFVAPFGDGWYRVFAFDRAKQVDDSEPVDLEEVRAVMRHAFGTDFGMAESRWVSRFHSDERQVPRYRVGRVFLAGDAAHCHSPAGGQGMNTGLQDAANLGWKLAAAVQGWAPQGLLDSYNDERHPVGKMVLRSSGALVRLALVKPYLARMARIVVGSAALRVPAVSHRAAGTITGIGISYGRPHGAHPSVGTRANDVDLTGAGESATRLYEALRTGAFVLIGREAEAPVPLDAWKGRVEYATASGAGTPAALTLVRPDGYVAWASDEHDAAARAAKVNAALAGALSSGQ